MIMVWFCFVYVEMLLRVNLCKMTGVFEAQLHKGPVDPEDCARKLLRRKFHTARLAGCPARTISMGWKAETEFDRTN